MNNGQIDLEDAMYRLYVTFYPNDKPVKTGFDALPAYTLSLFTQYLEATAHVISSIAYSLTGRVFSSPYTIENHTPKLLIRLRPASTHVYTYQSQHDLALAIRQVISKPAETQILQELACMTFNSINQPSLNFDLDSLRDSIESLAVAVHKPTRAIK